MRVPSLRLALMLLCALACAAAHAQNYKVIHTYPHDPHAFTQGLIFVDGHLYESAGQYGQSSLRMVDLETGRILQEQPVAKEYFAEGLAAWGSTLVQLTWQEHTALVYDRFSFRQLKTLNYSGEGWGLASDGKELILSDGTPDLRFLDPTTFHELRRVTVKDHGQPVKYLNELEVVRGEIYANVWYSDKIARISPRTGAVLGWIDLAGLLPTNLHSSPEAVLNGIAYDAAHDRLFVTGKLWPRLYEIQVTVAPGEKKATNRKKI